MLIMKITYYRKKRPQFPSPPQTFWRSAVRYRKKFCDSSTIHRAQTGSSRLVLNGCQAAQSIHAV